jgi:glycosyltransferase involved in cell wall biosynthesis
VDCERFRPASDEERGAARAALGLPAGDPIAVFVGRLERVKGPDLLIDAWAKLAHPAAVLVVAGDGHERAALEARGVPRVRFLGAVGDPVPLYRAADVAVVPSRSEGLSNALLEAMASGLSVVATAASAEVIEDGRTGRLVEPRAEAIANALAGALGARHASLGEAAARAARERYSLDATAAAYVALYRRLIGGRRRRGPGRRSS